MFPFICNIHNAFVRVFVCLLAQQLLHSHLRSGQMFLWLLITRNTWIVAFPPETLIFFKKTCWRCLHDCSAAHKFIWRIVTTLRRIGVLNSSSYYLKEEAFHFCLNAIVITTVSFYKIYTNSKEKDLLKFSFVISKASSMQWKKAVSVKLLENWEL